MRTLWEKNLITIQRVTESERDLARLEGERGELVASIAQTGGKKTEVGLQVIQIDQDLRSEVAAELRECRDRSQSSVSARRRRRISCSVSTSARRRTAACTS